jgi:hypothetical protein
MKRAEHQLRMCFDNEYRDKYLMYLGERKRQIGYGLNYFSNPRSWGVILNSCLLYSLLCAFFSSKFWWLGIPLGIVISLSISISVSIQLSEKKRRELGLERVWPW